MRGAGLMRRELRQPRSGQTAHTVASRVAVFKHPIHPMLVVFPVAFLSTPLLTDLLFLWLQQPYWAVTSYWLVVGGLAMGLFAACFGIADMFLLRSVRRHVSAWNHFIAGVMLLALAAAGVWWRHGDPLAAVWPFGLLLAAVTAGMTFVTGWLGGTLSFRHGVGVYGEGDPAEDAGDDSEPAGE
ncbi:hypothetical protein P873_02455 [Arenimonas composti TR7-09 = DSM 18010]|uniref:DUF2231 domain-containing protein n=2 Tax=Arenimonas TaxID=490567 RepID=A0A091B351_9GAMM|nr:hypothetical protein P873_02455 [Arenimonas composti TR7-09 = DSM 18010]